MPEPDNAVHETADAFLQRVAQVDITRCPRCVDGVVRLVGAISPRRILMPRTIGPPSWRPLASRACIVCRHSGGPSQGQDCCCRDGRKRAAHQAMPTARIRRAHPIACAFAPEDQACCGFLATADKTLIGRGVWLQQRAGVVFGREERSGTGHVARYGNIALAQPQLNRESGLRPNPTWLLACRH